MENSDYLTTAGIEAKERFEQSVKAEAANMTEHRANCVLESFQNKRAYLEKRGGRGIHHLLVEREAAKTVLAKNTNQ